MPAIDTTASPTAAEQAERDVLRLLRSLRYGALEIVVHDGRVVQIERREKTRYAAHGRVPL